VAKVYKTVCGGKSGLKVREGIRECIRCVYGGSDETGEELRMGRNGMNEKQKDGSSALFPDVNDTKLVSQKSGCV